jgi:hypothetical protein
VNLALLKNCAQAYTGVNTFQHKHNINTLAKRVWAMKFLNFIKNLVSPSANDRLSKLDAHLLADIGVNTAFARTKRTYAPSDLGVRLV